MKSIFNKVNIVLVGTTHPGNIGAAARALKTMSLGNLRLVNPLYFPSAEASARAAGADDILAKCEQFTSLEEALGPDSESSALLGGGSAHFQPQRTLEGEFWAKTKL